MEGPFKIYVIHHSHTDIGYTDYQEKIEKQHVYFIHKVIDILDKVHAEKKEWQGFKWNCESFFCVEKFLETADEKSKQSFFKYVKSGEIGISGSYLNLTDIVDYDALYHTVKRSAELMKNSGVNLSSAMTADINGYPWGYADILYENGVQNLLSCIHTHHGYYPLFKKQTAFYWKSPKGNKILVWNGEHYHIGNELGLTLQKAYPYMIHDGLNYENKNEWFETAEKRIEAYVRVLKEQDYPYDFVTVSVSGLMTDNASPSTNIIEFINRYNKLHGKEIELKMSTLDEYFSMIRETKLDIPTYSGDWTDWWSDGTGSTPKIVQHYREAQRKYYIAKQLDPDGKICGKELLETALYNMVIYSEHTWGYSSSINEPWHPYVNKLDLRKNLYAERANETVSRALNNLTYHFGETPLGINGNFKLTSINPHDFSVTDIISVCIETLFDHKCFEIIDEKTGEKVPYQIGSYSRGKDLVLLVHLKSKEKKTYILKEIAPPALCSSGTYAENGSDSVYDLSWVNSKKLKNGSVVTPYYLENQFFRIEYKIGDGITSIYNKKQNKELIKNSHKYNAFTPIYEVSPIEDNQSSTRRSMGRNRKAVNAIRDYGKLFNIKVLEDGRVYSKVELNYKVKGMKMCDLILTAYKDIPKIDVDFRCHKDSVWDPENVYLALPFTTGNDDEEFWVEKTGALLRPRIDQLPGTCTDYYALQSGMCFQSKEYGVVIATPDTQLITMGQLESHEIKLCGEDGVNNIDDVYAWVMNNFWETNFGVDLGGFHQYRYTLVLNNSDSVKSSFDAAKAANCPALGFYSFK